MKTNICLACFGLIILMIGIYLSSLLTTLWVIVGTLLACIGGTLTGINGYRMATTKND